MFFFFLIKEKYLHNQANHSNESKIHNLAWLFNFILPKLLVLVHE